MKRNPLLQKAAAPLIYIASILVLVVGYRAWVIGTFRETDVSYQSSDGEWADTERTSKGRHFDDIRWLFEKYRKNCSPSSVLQRTTKQPEWHTLAYWFNDYSLPKWQVPYAPPLPNAVGGYYPPANIPSCANAPRIPDGP